MFDILPLWLFGNLMSVSGFHWSTTTSQNIDRAAPCDNKQSCNDDSAALTSIYNVDAADNPDVLAGLSQTPEPWPLTPVSSGLCTVLVKRVVPAAPLSSGPVVAPADKHGPVLGGSALDGWVWRPQATSDLSGGRSAPELLGGAPEGGTPSPLVASALSCPHGLAVLGVTMVPVIGCAPQLVQVTTAVVKPKGIGVGVGKCGSEDIPA